MADKKTVYPMLPIGHWWGLRKKFKQSIPGIVTANYIATVLDMKEASARANVLPYLQQLGIIDEDGKTLERARHWRDDSQYADVCKEMTSEVYPSELREAAPGPVIDTSAAKRWFANATGGGEVSVRKMTALYAVLSEADPEKESPGTKRKGEPAPKKRATKKGISRKSKVTKKVHTDDSDEDSPSVHINLQIHVSSDSTPDQIDQIFSSMAKHIYRKD